SASATTAATPSAPSTRHPATAMGERSRAPVSRPKRRRTPISSRKRRERWAATSERRATMRRQILLAAAVACAFATPGTARAGEAGHFNPGVANIRDFYIPDPGFYGVLYDYWYT